MAIYRGVGGAGNATDDATIAQVSQLASQAATSASNAAASEANAASSASGASVSATQAAASASNAATSASTVASSIGTAISAANSATSSASAAATSANNAFISESNAANSASSVATNAASAVAAANNAAASASSASSSATNAATSASNASNSASAAMGSETAAAASAASALNSASSASTSASNAAASAVSAFTSASNASTSATDAASSAAAALVSENNAASSEANASSSESNAASSASSATASASAASASATSAANSASAASTSASNAANSASSASTSATNAANSASAASTSATSAANSASAASTSATNADNSATSAATSAAQANAVSLSNEPIRHSVRPSLLLDFSNTKALDPRVTFTRASEGRFYGTQTAKAEENLLLQSQDITTTWTNTGTTDTTNTSVAPDGTTTADTLTENATGTGQAAISQSVSFVSGLPYTFSVYVKQGTETFVQVFFGSSSFGANAFANFNVTTGAGAVGTVGASATASIVDAGNGWYRCIITATATATGSSVCQLNIIESATDARAPNITLNSGTVILWGAQLEQRSAVTAYTPTTTQPITNYIPVLQTAAAGVARFDHNPVTGESLGLLIEEQRTNLVLYSQEFDNAWWNKTRATITSNTIVAPDGTLTGGKLVEDTAASNTHYTRSTAYSTTSGSSYTWSVYLKAGERTKVRVALQMFLSGSAYPTTNPRVDVDLATGILSNSAGTTATSITSVGDGWYRVSVSATANSTQTDQLAGVYLLDASNNNTYTGDGYSGIYIWGAQLEVGAFPTSYIPTVASQVTRSADAASMTGANFSSWYRADEGTLFAEAQVPTDRNYSGTFRHVAHITPTASGNSSVSVIVNSSNQLGFEVRDGSSSQANLTLGSNTGIPNKWAGTYQVNNFALSTNGASATTDTSGQAPVSDPPTQIVLGRVRDGNALGTLNGTIRKIAYYPRRLTNPELQGLTS
jgi:hypothetical protein